MTIQDGLYSFTAMPRDGAGDEVCGVLIFHDGTIHGGDSFVYYTGTYECTTDRNWQGKITSQEHTPTTRPMPARVQQIGFIGTYSDVGATVDAMALFGDYSIRYDATLLLLSASGPAGDNRAAVSRL